MEETQGHDVQLNGSVRTRVINAGDPQERFCHTYVNDCSIVVVEQDPLSDPVLPPGYTCDHDGKEVFPVN